MSDADRDIKPRQSSYVRLIVQELLSLAANSIVGTVGLVLFVLGLGIALKHPAGIVILALGMLLALAWAAMGISRWDLWKRVQNRPARWCLAALLYAPLAAFAIVIVAAVGRAAVTGGWP